MDMRLLAVEKWAIETSLRLLVTLNPLFALRSEVGCTNLSETGPQLFWATGVSPLCGHMALPITIAHKSKIMGETSSAFIMW